jgi:hypothetical protein
MLPNEKYRSRGTIPIRKILFLFEIEAAVQIDTRDTMRHNAIEPTLEERTNVKSIPPMNAPSASSPYILPGVRSSFQYETARGNCNPMRKETGRRMIAVESRVDVREIISPGAKESAGRIAFIARTVGREMRAIKIKESASACLRLIFPPAKLPAPTYRSQHDRVIPISSSFPEKVERRRRRTVIWRRMEIKPMTITGTRIF